MSAFEILSTLDILIKLGSEIKSRLDSIPQAAEDLQLLDAQLKLFVTLFQDPASKDIPLMSEFVIIPQVLESIADLCTKCAKALDIDLAAHSTTANKTGPLGMKFVNRVRAFYKIPSLLAEIQRKAEQLHKIYTAISAVILHKMTTQQGKTSEKEIVKSASVAHIDTYEKLLHLDFSTGSASIDQLVGSIIEQCKHLRQRLQEAILCPDTSTIQDYQAQNPEGAAFWKDRFQKDELNASALRYETFYVSWARFVHEVEASFVLKNIPTGIFETGNIDLVREQGSRYCVDQNGTRHLSTIRPIWLPALRLALDPLHKGYVKPQDYFSLLQDSSLSDTLRRLVLQNAGYGTLVECERSSADLPLPAVVESPSGHVGWTSAQVVAVPTSDELGIVSERKVMESSSDAFFAHFNNITQDVRVYVRYLQTGQIELKSLLKQVRPIGGISIGAALSIRHELESGEHAWSCDLYVTEFEACYGGGYVITASEGACGIVFFTRPLKNSFDRMLRDDKRDGRHSSTSPTPEFDCTLLGPSKAFTDPPKVGEKIQIEYDGFWYDSRVTVVDGDEIEYVDWDSSPKPVPTSNIEAQNDSEGDERDNDCLSFSNEQLRRLGKGTRRLWRPWRRNIRRYDVRPYRCFHIGDSIDAPVMYPDFRFHYHTIEKSQLYLPARIVDVQGDQYVIEFSAALSVHDWWPGRMPEGEQVDLVPGSGAQVKNPFDFNRVMLNMDRVRPFSAGPRPVLGVQSAKPSGWSSFQGVHLHNLEALLEQSLWNDDQDSQRKGGNWRLFAGEE